MGNWVRCKLKNMGHYPTDTLHCKQWKMGPYLVRWRDMAFDVHVPAGYVALVKVKKPDNTVFIDLVWRYKIFRTRRAAMNACEDHLAGLDPAKEFKQRKIDKIQKRRVRRQKKIETKLMPGIKKPRKQRADKGKKRGVRVNNPVAPDKKPRKQQADKGKKRGPRKGVLT